MPGRTAALRDSVPLLLGIGIGLVPSLLMALADEMGLAVMFVPLLAATYIGFLVLAFIATACLMRSAQRLLGVGIALGLLLTAVFYVTLLAGAMGSSYRNGSESPWS